MIDSFGKKGGSKEALLTVLARKEDPEEPLLDSFDKKGGSRGASLDSFDSKGGSQMASPFLQF